MADILKNAAIVGIISFFGMASGYLRSLAIASYFGAGAETDALMIAQFVPEFIRNIFAGSIIVNIFIPVYSKLYNKDPEDAANFSSSLFTLIGILLSLGCLFSLFFPQLIMRFFAPGFAEHGRMKDAISMGLFTFPSMLPMGIASLTGGLLSCHSRFASAASEALLRNFSVIFLIILGTAAWGINAAAVGVLIGSCLMMIIHFPALNRQKLWNHLKFRLYHPSLKELFVAPMFIGLLASHINLLVDRMLATTLSEGSVAALSFAEKIMGIPVHLVGVTMATVLLPALSRHEASDDTDSFNETLNSGTRGSFFTAFPVSIFLVAAAYPSVSALLGYGRFHQDAVQLTAQVLSFYALGAWATVMSFVYQRCFYSMRMFGPAVFAAISSVVLNITLNLIFIGPLKARGLSLSTSISAIFQLCLLFYFLRRFRKVPRETIKSFLYTFVASIAAGFTAYSWAWMSYRTSNSAILSLLPVSLRLPQIGHILMLVFCIIIFSSVFTGISLLIGSPEIRIMINTGKLWIKKAIKRSSSDVINNN